MLTQVVAAETRRETTREATKAAVSRKKVGRPTLKVAQLQQFTANTKLMSGDFSYAITIAKLKLEPDNHVF